MTMDVKVYGIFRSGTNLIKLLAETSLDVKVAVNESGYKHLTSPINWRNGAYTPPGSKMIVCVKDPYASMTSLFAYKKSLKSSHFECAKGWKNFLNKRFVIKISHPSNPPATYFSSPVDYWNAFYYHFLSFEQDVLIVRYEDVIGDPDAVIERLSAFLGLPRLTVATPELPGQKLAKMGERLRDNPLTEREFDPAWYRDRLYMENYKKKQMKVMRRKLDPDVVQRLGYEVAPAPARDAHAVRSARNRPGATSAEPRETSP